MPVIISCCPRRDYDPGHPVARPGVFAREIQASGSKRARMMRNRARGAFALLALGYTLLLPVDAQPRHFKPEMAARESVELGLHEMDELDFWSKAQVYAYRKRRVLEYPELAAVFFPKPAAYQPKEDVFGQIEDGKPWWGILGLNYYGRGRQSIEGPSEETRFLGNPYLIAGVTERWAFQPRPLPRQLTPYYPKARSAVWSFPSRRFLSRFDVDSYLRAADGLGLERKSTKNLNVVLYNARDLGFTHAQLPEGRVHNVSLCELSSPFEIPQMLHAGASALYPGRANNMSPAFPRLEVDVDALPARFDVLLWRSKPAVGQEPELPAP